MIPQSTLQSIYSELPTAHPSMTVSTLFALVESWGIRHSIYDTGSIEMHVTALNDAGAVVITGDTVAINPDFIKTPTDSYSNLPGVTQRVVAAINDLPDMAYTQNELARILYTKLPDDSADAIVQGIKNAYTMKKYSNQIRTGKLPNKRWTWSPATGVQH